MEIIAEGLLFKLGWKDEKDQELSKSQLSNHVRIMANYLGLPPSQVV